MNYTETYPEKIFTHCPRCGHSPFTHDGKNSFLCGSCSFNYYINPSGAVVAIIKNSQGKILLTRRGIDPLKGTLDLPGGFVDLMESGEDALKREIREELNLEIRDFTYLGSFPNRYLYGGLTYFTLDLAYFCAVPSFEAIKADDDVSDYIFLHPEEINIDDIGLESIKKIIGVVKGIEE
ncbi:MAG: NUDIX domain-containing protein [bacterium]|nr:NUDIX domain-containing protein [bacterium]